MSWYVRSWAPGDVHRSVFDQGIVHAACDLKFFPIRVGDQAHYPRLPEAGQVCRKCIAQAANQMQ